MIDLIIFLMALFWITLGVVLLIQALNIPGFIRMVLGVVFACLPIAAGFWLFLSSDLHIEDTRRLFRGAQTEVENFFQSAAHRQRAIRDLFDR